MFLCTHILDSKSRVRQSGAEKGSFIVQLQQLQTHRWEYSRCPISWAVSCGLVEVTKDLVMRKVDVDEHDVQGRRALHEVCMLVNDSSKIVVLKDASTLMAILLEGGANPNCSTSCGHTPLHYLFLKAEDTGLITAHSKERALVRRKLLKQLLEWGADATLKDQNGLAPIHICVKRNVVDCLAVFITNDVTLNLTNSTRSSILHLACHARAESSVELIAYLDADAHKGMLTSIDLRGKTPLQLLPLALVGRVCNLWVACRRGDLARVRLIISNMVPDHSQLRIDTQGISSRTVTLEGEQNDDAVSRGVELTREAVVIEEDVLMKRRGRLTFADDEGGDIRNMYSEGINSKTRRMKWTCLHAAVAGLDILDVKSKKSATKGTDCLNLLRFLIQVSVIIIRCCHLIHHYNKYLHRVMPTWIVLIVIVVPLPCTQ
jgi:hypothetical protein